MEPQTTTEPGAGTGAVRAEPPGTGFICVRTDAHVFQKKPGAWRDECGQGRLRERTVLFNCKRRSTWRADPLYCSVVPEGQTERESSSAVFGIIWTFRWAAPVLQQ